MKPVDREILRLAVPAVIANITTPLLSLVDMAIVGHIGSPAFIAAIALGGTLFSMIYWVFVFLRMGTGGMTAQAFGARDTEAVDSLLYRALSVSLLSGAVLIFLAPLAKPLLLSFMGATSEASALAGRYFDILIFGAPASLSIYVFNGWFIGRRDSRRPMWLSMVVNIVNIVCSLVLVYGLNLGIDGVAAGTLVAQWAGFVAAVMMARRYRPCSPSFSRLLGLGELRRFFSVNADIFLRTLCLVAVTVWFTRAGARQGDTILSVNALLMQLFILFSYIMDGYAYAGEALVGNAVGAGDRGGVMSSVKALFRHGIAAALFFTAVYAIGGGFILSLLSDSGAVLATAGGYRWWAVLIPVAGVGAFIWDGVFIGATMTRAMLLSMTVAMAVFFAVYFLLSGVMGNHALWLAFILYLSSRALLQTLLFMRRR